MKRALALLTIAATTLLLLLAGPAAANTGDTQFQNAHTTLCLYDTGPNSNGLVQQQCDDPTNPAYDFYWAPSNPNAAGPLLKSRSSGLCVYVVGATFGGSINMGTCPSTSTINNAFSWNEYGTPDGIGIELYNYHAQHCMGVLDASTSPGVPMRQYTCEESPGGVPLRGNHDSAWYTNSAP